MSKDLGVLVLISGRGSNLRALIGGAKHYRIIGVLSNNPEAGGLRYAREAGIAHQALARSEYGSLAAFKAAVLDRCQAAAPDLIALAGYMQIIQPEFVAAFEGRLVNIHPALLPKFPGLHTHQRSLEAGEQRHGCTVHYLDAGVDTGPIIAQAECAVEPNDTEETLAQRVLGFEHRLYPWVVNQIARGGIRLEGGSVTYSAEACAAAAGESFRLGCHLNATGLSRSGDNP